MNRQIAYLQTLPRRVLVATIWLYQASLSGFLGSRCRFHPSCSQYAIEAVSQHGVFRGSVLATRRLCKCHPFHPGGIDHVPDQIAKESA